MSGMSFHIPTLETANLRLRAPAERDIEAYVAFCASDRATQVGGPFTRDQAIRRMEAILGHWALRGYGRWIVADRATDRALGIAGPFFPDGWPEPELGWTVFGDAEGRGVAHEASLAARAHVYGTLGWDTVISAIAPANTRSIALARRLGAVAEGSFEHPRFGTLQVWRHLPAREVA